MRKFGSARPYDKTYAIGVFKYVDKNKKVCDKLTIVNVDLVKPQSGLYLASGSHVVTDIDVVVSSGINVVTSGQTIVIDGIDYIQSGTQLAVINSGWISGTVGQFRMATAMKGLESNVSGWVGMANETRLFTGADNKHIRFHDTFQATALDPVKWHVEAGTATVANGYVSLATNTTIVSREKLLYGVLSATVYASNWNIEFGFQTDTYMQGGDSIVKIDNSQFETMNVGTNTATNTDIIGLGGLQWTDIDIVWTPTYCQLWINNELRITHTTNIPSNPAAIYIRNTQDIFLRVANVTLRPYGDIPLTAQGSVPVAGAYIVGSGMLGMEYIPIQVCSSGEVVVCSGLHVVADVQVDVSSGIHVLISGQHVYVESGVYVVADIAESGMGVQVQSGLHVQISGQHVYVESGVYIASGLAVIQESGAFVQISGQHVYVESGLHVVSASGTLHCVVDIGEIRLIDQSGNRAAFSRRHDALVQLPSNAREVHKGNMYHVGYCDSGVAAGSNLDVLIFTASGYEIHTTFGLGAGGEYMSYLFEKPVCTNSGTPITAHNMNRFSSGQPASLFSINPANVSGGLQIWCEAGGGAGFKGATPGASKVDTEWILNGVSGPVQYILRVHNREATDAKDIHINMDFSEEEPAIWW